jgi:cytoskeleton protein RodZ
MTNNILESAENDNYELGSPGKILNSARQSKQLTVEHVAERLHLRVKIIEAIESDDYSAMPEYVFIRGYLRAYANLLSVSADRIIEVFNSNFAVEAQADKTLWQNKKVDDKATKWVRFIKCCFIGDYINSIMVE